MKKIFTFSFALMASATMFAQTELWGGESGTQSIGTGGFWDRCTPEVVNNEKIDGINTSPKCLKFTPTGTDWNNACVGIDLPTDISFESKRLSLMIRTSFDSNVRVELECEGNTTKKVATWQAGKDNDDWQKLYFDFSKNGEFGTPKRLVIYPSTGNEAVGNVVYIDNIKIEEAPKVDGKALAECSNLSGNLKLTGSWLKGECQNADGENWQPVTYNDFNELAGKLTDNVTSIDMRGTTTQNVDINRMRNDNLYTLVFADKAYEENNVIAKGKCANLVLDENKTFFTPEGEFTAEKVTLNRPVYKGYNTMCLPFWVNAEDLKADAIYIYDSETTDGESTKINFKKAENGVDANIPFIAYYKDEPTAWDLKNKAVASTEEKSTGNFFANYEASKNAAGKYGLNAQGKFQRGGDNATINAFHAYLNLTDEQAAKPVLLAIDGETTGINAATIAAGSNEAVKVYNLQGCLVATAKSMDDLHLASGVYIVNNKKVVVK